MGYATKLINQLVLYKEGANVSEIDVTKDTSNDLSWLLFDYFWNDLALNIHHIVSKIGFDVGLHNRCLRLLLDKHFNHLQDLIVSPLLPQVIPSLFMLCFACYLLRGRVIAYLFGGCYNHAVSFLICDWNVWNIFQWWWSFVEWIIDSTLKHGIRSFLVAFKYQSGIL